MAIIHRYTRPDDGPTFDHERIEFSGSVIGWILENIGSGVNFEVYEGELTKENEISRDENKMALAEEVSIFILPSGPALPFVITLVVSVAATLLLAPSIDKPKNLNRNQQSPNNDLSDRRNRARPNQRICDIVGKVKSIPDVIQREYARYNDNIEERFGYYCVGRNQLQIEDIKDGDSLISDLVDASAGVYYPNKSPNNSAPDIQIGEPISESVVGVYQSSEAIGQTIKAPNEDLLILDSSLIISSSGYIEDPDGVIGFNDLFEAGDSVVLDNVWATGDQGEPLDPSPYDFQVGANTTLVTSVTEGRITFDISGDSSWAAIDPSPGNLVDRSQNSQIILNEIVDLGPFRNTSIKVDKLFVNCHAINGMYKENNNGRRGRTVKYNVISQKLNDNLDPVGAAIVVSSEISGRDSNEKGTTTEIDLGGLTFVEWSLQRVTPKDYDFNGSVVDDIKLKDVFGLYDIGATDFGNVTTIQTKRTSVAQTTSIREPELNCIATEMVNKYESGAFSLTLTPNTQGMQSLIRLALDPYVGRRTEAEIDLDLLVQTQSDVETYFASSSAGQCSYTFDSTNISAQEIFFTIGDAIFCILWREGRLLKSWFERPQTIPQLVFTHRSKKPDSETWVREFAESKRKDSIEFKYTNEELYTQETLYFPSDRTGTNPLKLEIPGIKGVEQATWRMMREYNKLLYKEVSVDFSATQEGRFTLPSRLISVVKGSRVGSYDGYIVGVDGLTLTLSQDVSFTPDDDHFILLKRRDGTVESIPVTDIGEARQVQMGFVPTEQIYTDNDELKTEFSFGNEARLSGQLMLPVEINPSPKQYVGIKAINYTDNYYQDDPVQTVLGGFDEGFNEGFG